MDFIIADETRMEEGFLSAETIDLEIGDAESENDFELTLPLTDVSLDYGKYVFVPGTEYGGIIEDRKTSTSENIAYWYGNTWRGFLNQVIIEPPSGSDYKTVSGEANAVMRTMLSGKLGGMFVVPSVSSGITVSYQFSRYASYLDGFMSMLKQYNARLEIWVEQGGANESFTVYLKAVPIVDYSEEIEYSQDNKVNLTIRDCRRGVNHLICLGQGELADRQVLHLYVQKDGTIGTTKYYTGLAERTAVYDYSSAEDLATLEEYGIKRLKESMNYKKLEMSVQDLDIAIGDIVAGRERKTGAYLSKPIVRKIVKLEGTKTTIEYKVEGED